MIRKLGNLVLILFVISLINKSFAQNDSISAFKFQLAFVPHYLAYSGMRIDVEYVKNKKHSFLLTPQFYIAENNGNNNLSNQNDDKPEFDKLAGYGIGAYHKLLSFFKRQKFFYVYFEYGFEYAHFSIDYSKYDWVKFIEYDIEYIRYDLVSVNQQTDRLNINFNMGFQLNFAENMFIGGYLGMGVMYSFVTSNSDFQNIVFNENMYDYAYSGIFIPVGFRLGIRF